MLISINSYLVQKGRYKVLRWWWWIHCSACWICCSRCQDEPSDSPIWVFDWTCLSNKQRI